VNRWLAFLNSDLHPMFKPVFGPQRYIDDEQAQEALRTRAIERLRAYYERLDGQLHGRDWLTGTRSFADPYLFVVLRWAMAKGVDLSGLDNLARFFERMSADAGVKAAMQQEGI
jgi:glutathione S-transferase